VFLAPVDLLPAAMQQTASIKRPNTADVTHVTQNPNPKIRESWLSVPHGESA
jgi:hypothetical protein